MKVGIFTFPNSTSYGATLQMYALYHTVNKLGHEAEIINYHNKYMKAEKHIGSSYHSPIKRKLKKAAQKLLHNKLYKSFRDFEKKTMRLYPSRALTDKNRLIEIGKKYDAVICGSDQVWNPDITDTDLSYFLDFCGEQTRRISYAPSFGIDCFTDEFCKKISPELEKFYAISVREREGKDIIERMLGRDAALVLDPTLLVAADEWQKLCKAKSFDKEYILYYTVKGSPALFEMCKNFAKATGLKMVVVGGNIIRKIKNKDPQIQYVVDISPSEWLGLMRSARYVVTNSFHGTAFSVIFRKSFYLEMSSLTNSRLIQIIKNFGFEDRVVKPGDVIQPKDIDYSYAETRLSCLVGTSLEYLNNALREAENG